MACVRMYHHGGHLTGLLTGGICTHKLVLAFASGAEVVAQECTTSGWARHGHKACHAAAGLGLTLNHCIYMRGDKLAATAEKINQDWMVSVCSHEAPNH